MIDFDKLFTIISEEMVHHISDNQKSIKIFSDNQNESDNIMSRE